MYRIRSDELLHIRVRPGGDWFITLDEPGIAAQKGKPLRPEFFVAFPEGLGWWILCVACHHPLFPPSLVSHCSDEWIIKFDSVELLMTEPGIKINQIIKYDGFPHKYHLREIWTPNRDKYIHFHVRIRFIRRKNSRIHSLRDTRERNDITCNKIDRINGSQPQLRKLR